MKVLFLLTSVVLSKVVNRKRMMVEYNRARGGWIWNGQLFISQLLSWHGWVGSTAIGI